MKKSLKILTSALVSTFVLAGCASGGGTTNGDTVKIGLNYELSGNVSTYGTSLVEGIELAFKEINAKGGVLGKKVELVKLIISL